MFLKQWRSFPIPRRSLYQASCNRFQRFGLAILPLGYINHWLGWVDRGDFSHIGAWVEIAEIVWLINVRAYFGTDVAVTYLNAYAVLQFLTLSGSIDCVRECTCTLALSRHTGQQLAMNGYVRAEHEFHDVQSSFVTRQPLTKLERLASHACENFSTWPCDPMIISKIN